MSVNSRLKAIQIIGQRKAFYRQRIPESSCARKETVDIDILVTFKDFGLEIVAESNLRIVNYLDVILNLNNSSFKPYHKPDDIIQYIVKESNHPPSIIKHLVVSIEKQLSNNSSDEKNIKRSSYLLNKPGYINKLVYHTPSAGNQENKNKNCQRNVIWFNPHTVKVSQREQANLFYTYQILISQKTTSLIRYSTEIKLK